MTSRRSVVFACAIVFAACSESVSPGPGGGGNPVPTATRLSFTDQPQSGIKDSALPTTVRVSVLDQSGTVLSSATTSISLALGANPGGASLAGPTSASAVNGVASFAGLKLDRLG